MDFYLDKKQAIVIGALAFGLLTGGIVLWRQGGIGFLGANLNQAIGQAGEWTEIKPRVADSDAGAVILEKDSSSNNIKKAAKSAAQAIKWCDVNSGAAPLAEKEVIFNEVAWMGTAASYADEWMELKNISERDIDLSGWQLQNKSQKIKIVFGESEILPAAGLYLLERTDDETIGGVPADKIYKGGLANTNEAVYLFDRDCVLRDAVFALPKWPAGDNGGKRTMIRVPGLSWQNGVIEGTPRAENQ